MALTGNDIDTILLALQHAREVNDPTAPSTDKDILQFAVASKASQKTTITGWLNAYKTYAQGFVDTAETVAANTIALYGGIVTACTTAIADLP